jgi:hypothetical protein
MSTSEPVLAALPSRAGRRRAVAFIVLIGTVSLFADMTYEGARDHRTVSRKPRRIRSDGRVRRGLR